MNRMCLKFPIALALACAGCASAPVSYFTLIPAAASSNAESGKTCCIVEIRSVRIPSAVDRSELVIRQSDAQLAVLSNDLWVAPLRDEVRSALLNDIRGKLPQAQSGPAVSPRKFVVFVDVSRFESQAASYALIEAEWRVEPADAAKSAAPVCKALVQVSVAGGVSGLVRGYQQAISRLASNITLNVVAADEGGAVECPAPPPGV
jgi:uncharacterized protein